MPQNTQHPDTLLTFEQWLQLRSEAYSQGRVAAPLLWLEQFWELEALCQSKGMPRNDAHLLHAVYRADYQTLEHFFQDLRAEALALVQEQATTGTPEGNLSELLSAAMLQREEALAPTLNSHIQQNKQAAQTRIDQARQKLQQARSEEAEVRNTLEQARQRRHQANRQLAAALLLNGATPTEVMQSTGLTLHELLDLAPDTQL